MLSYHILWFIFVANSRGWDLNFKIRKTNGVCLCGPNPTTPTNPVNCKVPPCAYLPFLRNFSWTLRAVARHPVVYRPCACSPPFVFPSAFFILPFFFIFVSSFRLLFRSLSVPSFSQTTNGYSRTQARPPGLRQAEGALSSRKHTRHVPTKLLLIKTSTSFCFILDNTFIPFLPSTGLQICHHWCRCQDHAKRA